MSTSTEAGELKSEARRILNAALCGYNPDPRYKTEDGYTRWGLVESDIGAAIDAAFAAARLNPETNDA